ncbi:MAG: D-alanyl-D-alanine carboxypeptidase/D-alanyl-D-alanine-endopeptidase [Bergeyella sp.]
MTRLKNYLTGFSVVIAGMLSGQGSNLASPYSQMYENQVKTISASAISNAVSNVILSPKDRIDITLEGMMNDPVLKNASWGFVVYDPKTKKVVSSYNENTPLIPASTTKLLTTDTAMDLLGENFKWITQLEYSGTIDETGVLNGNLYIVGSGDPSLGTGKAGASTYSSIINEFIDKMKETGIKRVSGDIIIQTAFFKQSKMNHLPANIVWMEHGSYYLPVGSTADTDPKKEKSVVKQSNPFDESKKYFYISPYTSKIVYTDDFSGNTLTTKLPDAPAYLANNLRANMVKRGIAVSGKVVNKLLDYQPEARNLITAYKSPLLKDIVYYTNQKSDNALAEATLRMVGFQKKGDQTLETGKEVVVEHLKSVGFDTLGLNYVDGSGLSRSHSVTPISQVKFLTSLMDKEYFNAYFESLPIGGQSGTLKKMFTGSGYGIVHAKTGTLNKVKALAGYIKTYTGKTLVFSLLVNNYGGSVDQVKYRMEQLLEPVYSY